MNPAKFTRTYNAVQLATAPVLAVSGNSPTFLGHRLWEETRIAVCKTILNDHHLAAARRAATPRPAPGRRGCTRHGAGRWNCPRGRPAAPGRPLPALRRHAHPAGDRGPRPTAGGAAAAAGAARPGPRARLALEHRAIYDPTSGGHLRIEIRALPAAPP